jgi:hypothetical protein
MKVIMRMVALAALAGFMLLRAWMGVLGLAQIVGADWAIAVGLALLLCRLVLPLQIAVLLGALTVWHWPLLLAVIVAAPRLILVLPGLISTFLAARRHPRPRWSGAPVVPTPPRA